MADFDNRRFFKAFFVLAAVALISLLFAMSKGEGHDGFFHDHLPYLLYFFGTPLLWLFWSGIIANGYWFIPLLIPNCFIWAFVYERLHRFYHLYKDRHKEV